MKNVWTKKNTTTNPTEGAFACMSATWMQNGLTKREYFAAVAMQGLLTRVPQRPGNETDLGIIEAQRIVAESCIMADLLVKELNLEGEDGGDNE